MATYNMKEFESKSATSQPLLVPLQLELSHKEVQILDENLDTFKNLGFEIESFGGNTFNLNAVPHVLSREDAKEVVLGVLDDISNQKSPTKVKGQKEAMIEYMACRSAIKFGKRLSEEEQVALIRELDSSNRPYTCPHGRPSMIRLTFEELEKRFGR